MKLLQENYECLSVVEKIEDTDYYFLTVECLKKIYQTSEYEDFVEEEIYMSSALYKEPYEKGREEGIAKGLQEGETKTLVRTTIKFLIKKFGIIPDDLKESTITEHVRFASKLCKGPDPWECLACGS
jgi:flagellar biosynthesis/type III secretory pathway protein FliH